MITSLSTVTPQAVASRAFAAPTKVAQPTSLADRVELSKNTPRELDPADAGAGAIFGGVIASQIAIPIGSAAAGPMGSVVFGIGAAVAGASMGYGAGFKSTAIAGLGALVGSIAGGAVAGIPGRAVGALAGGFLAHKLQG